MYDFATIGALVGIIGCEQYSAKGCGEEILATVGNKFGFNHRGIDPTGKKQNVG